MLYDIYFHDDIDGRASAAVILAYLRQKGDCVGRYVPLDLGIIPRWEKVVFKHPAIVLDFPYHPKAAWWLDHHPTTFLKKKWEKTYEKSALHVWDPKYDSCSHLVLDVLVRKFGFKLARHLKEMVCWLDVIDAANFASAKQTIEIKEPALQLEHFVDERGTGKDPLVWLIEAMSRRPLSAIAKDTRVKTFIKNLYKRRNETLRFYKKHLEVFGKVAFLDTTAEHLIDLRFVPYYIDPGVLYTILIKKHGGQYGVHLGANPWRRKEVKIHVGNIMRSLGGGGHRFVGGLRAKSKAEVQSTAKHIISFLNKKT